MSIDEDAFDWREDQGVRSLRFFRENLRDIILSIKEPWRGNNGMTTLSRLESLEARIVNMIAELDGENLTDEEKRIERAP